MHVIALAISLIANRDCYCGRSRQMLKWWNPVISVATGGNRKWKLNKAFCGTANNTSTIPARSLSNTFLWWQFHDSLWECISAEWSTAMESFPAGAEPHYSPSCRRYKDTLCHSSWRQPCVYLATFFLSPWSLHLLFRPHTSPSLSLSSKAGFLHIQSFFLHLSGLFPAEPYLSRGVEIVLEPRPCHCQVEWKDCPVSSAAFCSVQVFQEDWQIFAALDFCSSPKHHSTEPFSTQQQPGQLLLILYLRNWF